MSQEKQIKHYLESGGKISGISALDKFGCYRLSAVIFNLREKGLDIKTKMVATNNGQKKYAEYYLENPTGNKDQYKLELL
tara:strand:- start:4011 stop:4250 length:240 start_codon:yes stop_codon:yes gene_type:complete